MNIIAQTGQSVKYALSPPETNKIPKCMRSVAFWVVWKLEQRDTRATKIPYNPHTGTMARSNDPATWATLEKTVSAYSTGKYTGIGFMLASGFAGIDLDHCRNAETGEVEAWASQIVAQLASYTEISPSGTGLHIFIKGKLARDGINKRNVNGHAIEIYDSGRYFTFTGKHFAGTPLDVCERQTELDALYSEVIQATEKKSQSPQQRPERYVEVTSNDSEVMELAINAKNGSKFERLWDGDTSGYKSHSEADLALIQILCFYSQDDAQVEHLWKDSKLYRAKAERGDYVRRTIAEARANQTQHYKPKAMPATEKSHSEVAQAIEDDPPISTDAEREKYLRKIWANHNRVAKALMFMAAALGFKKLPWRLINAIHGNMSNKLGVRAITNERLQTFYTQSGESADSLATVRADKDKLWKAQKKTGIELIWYWHGRKNPATGEGIASRYQSHLARWTLKAIDLCIERYGYQYRDEHLKLVCAEIAARIARDGKGAEETERKDIDGIKLELKAESGFRRDAELLAEAWDILNLSPNQRQDRATQLIPQIVALLLEPNPAKRRRNERQVAAMVKAVINGDDASQES